MTSQQIAAFYLLVLGSIGVAWGLYTDWRRNREVHPMGVACAFLMTVLWMVAVTASMGG